MLFGYKKSSRASPALNNDRSPTQITNSVVFLQAFKDSPHYAPPSVAFMPTERCAKLMAVSMANNLDEVWISEYPFLQLLYLNQYFPDLVKWCGWLESNVSVIQYVVCFL